MKYEIVYQTEYIGRELYILKIKDKFLPVYKSSGLAGHNSKGIVLPFTYIKTTHSRSYSDNTFGWISKEYLCDRRFREYYSKDLNSFDWFIRGILTQLTEDLSHIKLEQTNWENISDEDFYSFIRDVSKEIKDIVGKNLYDFEVDR